MVWVGVEQSYEVTLECMIGYVSGNDVNIMWYNSEFLITIYTHYTKAPSVVNVNIVDLTLQGLFKKHVLAGCQQTRLLYSQSSG